MLRQLTLAMEGLKRFVILTFVLVLPVTAWSQSTLNFPRGFSPADLGSTGFAIVNPGPANAVVAYTLYGPSGQALATSSQTIPAQGQVAKLGSEIFPQAAAAGWVQATSTTAGLQGFWLGGDFVTYANGAEAAVAAADLIFPLVAGQTEINVGNPNTSSITITFRLLGANGLEVVPSKVQPLVGRGFLQTQISSLFSGANLAQATHIRATCTGPCAGTSVLTNYLVSPSWGVINAVDAASGVTEANFPHVISGIGGGGNYTTVIGVTNLTSASQAVTVTFTPVSGAAQSITRTLVGNGALRDTAQNLFGFTTGFKDGWVKVTGTAPITGFVAYGETVHGGLAVIPVQGTPRTTMLFDHIADLPPWSTGLALLNTGTSNATVDVYAMTPSGSLIGGADNVPTAHFTLTAGTKRAALLSELIPQTQARTSDGGFVFVRSSVPLYGMELFFNQSLTILSNVAAGVIAPGINFTPPVAPPVITSVSPNIVVWGQAATFRLTGTSMSGVTGVEFSDSGGLRNLANISSTSNSVSFTLSIGTDAQPGVRSLAVIGPGGRSNSIDFVIRSLPRITDITPPSVQMGSSGIDIDLTITGSNLEGVTSINFSPSAGISVSNVQAEATKVTASLSITSTATIGSRLVTVTTAAGTSNTLPFEITRLQLLSISPFSVARGTTVTLTLRGTLLSGTTSISFEPSDGLAVTDIQSTNTLVTAQLTVGSTASLGVRAVTVTTSAGVTEAVRFSITGPVGQTNAPSISNVRLNAPTFSGAGATVSGSFDFTDPDGDIFFNGSLDGSAQLIFTFGTCTARVTGGFLDKPNQRSGSVQFSSTYTPSRFTVGTGLFINFALRDAAGNSSPSVRFSVSGWYC